MVIVGCIFHSHRNDESQWVSERVRERRTGNIYFFYGIIRLKNCFSIELLSPIYGAKSEREEEKRDSACLSFSLLLFPPITFIRKFLYHNTNIFHLRFSNTRQLFLTFLLSLKLYFFPSFLILLLLFLFLLVCHVTQSEIINWHFTSFDSHQKVEREKIASCSEWWEQILWFNGVTQ